MSTPEKTIEDIGNEYARALAGLAPSGYFPKVALLDDSGRKKRKDAAARNWNPLSGSISITYERPGDSENAIELPLRETNTLAQKIDKSVEKMMKATGMRSEDAAQAVTDFQQKAKERDEKRTLSVSKALEPTGSVPPAVVSELPAQIAEAIRALDSAERSGSYFVALKRFRDQELPRLGGKWAMAPAANQDIIKNAIELGIFLTNKVPNPKSPAFPTTAIRLNRQSAEVQRVLGSSSMAQSRVFRPLEIKGAGLSDTILKERG
jgi:hypothetical protein